MKKGLSLVLITALLISTLVFSASAATVNGKNLEIKAGDAYDVNNWRFVSKNSDGVGVEDGVIVTKNAQDGDLFGPQGVYDEFTVSFDLILRPGMWFGFTFGNANADDFFGETDQVLFIVTVDRAMLLIPVKSGGGEHYFPFEEGGTNWLPANMFELSEDDEYSKFKLTFDKDKTLKVYYQMPDDADAVMDTPRAVYKNVPETEGFMNFVSTASAETGSNYEIKNLKVFNKADADITQKIPAAKTEIVSEGVLTQAASSKASGNTVDFTVDEGIGAVAYAANVFDKDGVFIKSEMITNPQEIKVTGLSKDTEYTIQLVALGGSNVIIGYLGAVEVKTTAENDPTKVTESTKVTTQSTNDTPSTGEKSNFYLFALVGVISAAAFILISKKKLLNK